MKTIANKISAAADVELFKDRSAVPKWDAQQNLQGRTHYVEDSTLKYFGARIVSAYPTDDGLFFKIVESVSLSPNGGKRGFRVVVFDLFGQAVFRPSFEECTPSSAAADKHYGKTCDIDPVQHYRAELAQRATKLANKAQAMQDAAQSLEEVTT